MKLARDIWQALGGSARLAKRLAVTGVGDLPSAYPVSDFAAATVGVATLAVAELLDLAGFAAPEVTVDRRLASFWFASSIRPLGWSMPTAWDPVAGDYATRDGWIRLHTNAAHHRAAALRVLGDPADREGVARAVASWNKGELEAAIVGAGGCAAEMRSVAEWAAHPQGRAIAAEPLAHVAAGDRPGVWNWTPRRDRPLAGLRVLDLTRVLAGPVASRFLAGYGAAVLRIDPPVWDERSVVPDMTPGKACARLDLHNPADRLVFEGLLRDADIMVHGYRPGALDGLGYGAEARRALAPGLIDVSLCAYGWSGPWAGRRGFDSLVQMSSGIADAGMGWKGADRPVPLPVQALDHATGYLMAAATVRAIGRRLATGAATTARLSLARTARLLVDLGMQPGAGAFAPEGPDDLSPAVDHTAWGAARRLLPPASVSGAPVRWDSPPEPLGSSEPRWANLA